MLKMRGRYVIFLSAVLFLVCSQLQAGEQQKEQVPDTNVVSVAGALKLTSDQPAEALKEAQKALLIPDATFSRKQKVAFFQKLATAFQEKGHYKEAYFCLKAVDSLELLPPENLSVAKTESQSNWPVYLLYLFLIVFLLLVVYVYVSLRSRNLQLSSLKSEHEKLLQEQNKLQKELQTKIEEENEGLQKQLDQLKSEELVLKSSLQKVEKSSYLRNAFIANLGFDVRTSLTGIIGFANMLETELAVKENRDLYIFASSIEKSGNRLLRLLSNVIDLSAVEAHTMEFVATPLDLNGVMGSIYQKFSDQARDKNLIFKFKEDKELPAVFADEKALEKVLEQVTDNAVRYTEQGFVTLSAYYNVEKEMNVIEVKDTGPGMDRKIKQLIFSSVDPETADFVNYGTGTGIGLKLARRLLMAMHGKMELISNQGEGTIVQIFLPCSEKTAAATVKDVSVEDAEVVEFAEKLDLFVLEDDRMNRLILDKMLKKLGDVELAVDGTDCLEKVKNSVAKGRFYQVMIFDINLPDEWDGVMLMKEIRNRYPEYRNIPFIAQTAYAMEGDKERFLAEGFDSYLSKPIDRNELFAVIQQQMAIYEVKNKTSVS
ncbi:MAG: response regulator [Bacteroidales bacterium]|nr:response regulator [Bacteroidales bacterium]